MALEYACIIPCTPVTSGLKISPLRAKQCDVASDYPYFSYSSSPPNP